MEGGNTGEYDNELLKSGRGKAHRDMDGLVIEGGRQGRDRMGGKDVCVRACGRVCACYDTLRGCGGSSIFVLGVLGRFVGVRGGAVFF